MNTKGWLYLFFADLVVELAAIINGWTAIRFFSKPLLVAVLLVWFLSVSDKFTTLRYTVVAALLLSWLGDIFLLLEPRSPVYFMAGLGSFLLAHIAYIFFFLWARAGQNRKKSWNIKTITGVTIYAGALFFFLNPRLGALKLPVFLYALVISVMLICALHAFAISARKAGWWCISGAALFVLSDSVLAVNKFYQPFPAAGFSIMLTYAGAQFALVKGSLLYLAENIYSSSKI